MQHPVPLQWSCTSSGPPASMGQSFLQTSHAAAEWPVSTKAGQSAHQLANQHMGWPTSPSTKITLHFHAEQDTPMLHTLHPKTSRSLYKLLTYSSYALTFVTHDGPFQSFGKSFKPNPLMMTSIFPLCNLLRTEQIPQIQLSLEPDPNHHCLPPAHPQALS